MTGTDAPWHHADLVALDLEGSGAQDRDHEAILEIALVPLHAGHPTPADAYTTLINPDRTITPRRWISPGLTNDALRHAPPLADIAPELARRLDGRWLVGHNIGVDWRLLHRRCPHITPAGLIDTLRLARASNLNPGGRSLTTLLEHLELTATVRQAAPHSQPHRALWDAIGTAVLLRALVTHRWPNSPTIDALRRTAGLPPPNDTPDRLF